MADVLVNAGHGTRDGTEAPVGWPFIVTYALALLGAWMTIMTPATVTLAMRVGEVDPLGKEQSYSLISGVGALCAIVANPLFGLLSDRTTSAFGMRRPWILLGAVGGCAGAAIIALATSVTMLTVGWAVMQTLCNAGLATLVVVIADRVPAGQRGLVSGVIGTTPTLGILMGSWLVAALPAVPRPMLLVPALAGLALALLFSFAYPDRVLAKGPRTALTFKAVANGFRIDMAAGHGFLWCLAALFLASSAIAVFQTYLVFYLEDALRVPAADIASVAFYTLAASNVTAAVAAPFAGALSDYLGARRAVFIAGVLLMAAGLGVMAAAHSIAQFCAGSAILGLGYGIFSGLYTAIVLDVVPNQESFARDLGFGNIALTVPYFAVPVVAPWLLALGAGKNYTALSLAGIALTLAAIPIMKKVTRH